MLITVVGTVQIEKTNSSSTGNPSMWLSSIPVIIVIMKQPVWNTWVDTAREPMKIYFLVKNVIQYPYETQRRKHFKCQIESKHDGPMYPFKDFEAPINAEEILKCDKCKHTLVFRTLMC